MAGEACLPSNAYYPRIPDFTLYSGVHVCWSEHSDSSFVYRFMSLDYGFGTMTATTIYLKVKLNCCAGCFLPAWRRLCTNSASYEFENKSTSNGAQLVPIGMPIVC